MAIQIRIENLPPDATEEELRELLKSFCQCDHIQLNHKGSDNNLTAWIDVPTNRTHGYLLVRKIQAITWRGHQLNAYASLFGSR